MNKLLIGLTVMPFLAGVAVADQPTLLKDAQMDKVTAGSIIQGIQLQATSLNLQGIQSQASSLNLQGIQSQSTSFNGITFNTIALNGVTLNALVPNAIETGAALNGWVVGIELPSGVSPAN